MSLGLPFFSIILPTYNRANTINKPIESVIRQTYLDWELIIVDDGSSDNTKNVISKYLDDNRIKYFFQTNKERSAARNFGIINAKGKYICFIDSDDTYLDNHLNIFFKNITENGNPIGLFFTKTLLSLADNNLIIKPVPSITSLNKFSFLMHYTFTPINVCISKPILDKIKFDERINFGEDMDLWLRIVSQNYPLIEINEATAIYNAREDMFGSNADKYLLFYKIIFNKPELKKHLPGDKKHMLLSKCYFHLALKFEKEKKILKMYISIIKSFILFPKGYNNKNNKVLFVMFLYHLPLFGYIIKHFIRFAKQI